MTACALSSDGRLLARSSRTLDGPNIVVQLHALPDGSELGTLPTEMSLVSELLLTPDGQGLVAAVSTAGNIVLQYRASVSTSNVKINPGSYVRLFRLA